MTPAQKNCMQESFIFMYFYVHKITFSFTKITLSCMEMIFPCMKMKIPPPPKKKKKIFMHGILIHANFLRQKTSIEISFSCMEFLCHDFVMHETAYGQYSRLLLNM